MGRVIGEGELSNIEMGGTKDFAILVTQLVLPVLNQMMPGAVFVLLASREDEEAEGANAVVASNMVEEGVFKMVGEALEVMQAHKEAGGGSMAYDLKIGDD